MNCTYLNAVLWSPWYRRTTEQFRKYCQQRNTTILLTWENLHQPTVLSADPGSLISSSISPYPSINTSMATPLVPKILRGVFLTTQKTVMRLSRRVRHQSLTSRCHSIAPEQWGGDYLNTYYLATGTDKSLLRNIFKVLTRDGTCAENSVEAEIDKRVMSFVMNSADLEEEIIHDLRRLNGKPNSTKFDVFWNELQGYFDEVSTAVNDRRHGENNYYLPFALSIEDLRDTIKQRIEAGVHRGAPIPSAEWLRLQFCH